MSRDQERHFWWRSWDQGHDFDQRSQDQVPDFTQRSGDQDQDITERSWQQQWTTKNDKYRNSLWQETHETRVLIWKSARKNNCEEIKFWLWQVWKFFKLLSLSKSSGLENSRPIKAFASWPRPSQDLDKRSREQRQNFLVKVSRRRARL